jgi:DNA-directed RNA polymerase subunit RPC12/RpoP
MSDRRNLIVGGIALAIFAAAALLYYWRANPSAQLPKQVGGQYACLACKRNVQLTHGTRETPPFTCPDCRQRAAYPLLVCNACRKHFVPNLERRAEAEFPKLPIMPSCLACGSINVGAYIGAEPIPADQLVLPKWP